MEIGALIWQEALCDCGSCHTPRNLLGGEKTSRAYAGAVVDGWIAPALNEANPSVVSWTREELFTFLRTGASRLHGAAGATMTPVIRDGLAASGGVRLRYSRHRRLLQRYRPR